MNDVTPDRLITEPPERRRRSRLKRILSYAFLPALGLGLVTMVILVAVGASLLTNVRHDLDQLRTIQTATCRATNAARAESNRDLRVPLKRAVELAGGGTPAQRAARAVRVQVEIRQLAALAAREKDPGVRAVIAVLVSAYKGNPKETDAYAQLAAQIKTVALLNCQTGKAET